MKKMLMLLVSVMFLTGCGNKSNLRCILNEYEFEDGKINIEVIYDLDEQEYVESSTKKENRFYDDEKDAKEFYEEHTTFGTMKSDTEVEYYEALTFKEKAQAETIKSAMEAQGYLCEYKN